MELKPASPADEVPGYTQLQRQIHHALRAQHPEWLQPNGNSPVCDSYESRFAEVLRTIQPSLNNHAATRVLRGQPLN
jgi:hypothetical protein